MANGETRTCPQCGAPFDPSSKACKYCGAEIAIQPQYQATVPIQQTPQQPPQYTVPQAATQAYAPPVPVAKKNKTTAGLLGIFLGGLGVHKFYLGKIGWGIAYLVFCWTYIPAIVGFIEGIIYLASSEESFQSKYSK